MPLVGGPFRSASALRPPSSVRRFPAAAARSHRGKQLLLGIPIVEDKLVESATAEILSAAKFQGHWNYYGVIGNSHRLQTYWLRAKRLVFKWLNRRSLRRSYNWTTFAQMWAALGLPPPRIVDAAPPPPTLLRPVTITADRPTVRSLHEPGAGIPHAGISEGPAEQPAVLP